MRPHPFACVRLLLSGLALALVLPALAADPVPEDKAVFTVKLPAKAVLTIDEAATKSTGAEPRSYLPRSPPASSTPIAWSPPGTRTASPRVPPRKSGCVPASTFSST